MKHLKRTFCIFLAVMMLFFGVNNSYFSPHKMDTVEAGEIIIGGGFVITTAMIVELISALTIAGLVIGLIIEWTDMDIEYVLNDLHDWLSENIEVLDSIYVDGTSALKEWAQTDEWTIIEGGGGSLEPSPDPELKNSLPAQLTLATLATAADIVVEELYNKPVTVSEEYMKIAQSYIEDKIESFPDIVVDYDANGNPVDPITYALQSRYELLENEQYNYLGEITYNDDGQQIINYMGSFVAYDSFNTMIVNGVYVGLLSGDNLYFYKNVDGIAERVSSFRFSTYTVSKMESNFGTVTTVPSYSSKYIGWTGSNTINVPIFRTLEEVQNYFDTGDESGVINVSKPQKYIDLDGHYSWANTANISPSGLIAANPSLAESMAGRKVSFSSLVSAIDELQKQLDEQNPNVDIGEDAEPVPYPDVPTYTAIVNQVIADPEIFPEASTTPEVNPDAGTETNPDVEPDTGTESSLNYTGLLGTIISILQNILQAIRDFFAWFIIDFPLIKEYLLNAIENVPLFDSFGPIIGYIEFFRDSISDDYVYPVIKITTPDVLRPYYDQPEIILCDFEDYAKYFVWVRAVMSFAIVFGFALWIISEVRDFFTGL